MGAANVAEACAAQPRPPVLGTRLVCRRRWTVAARPCQDGRGTGSADLELRPQQARGRSGRPTVGRSLPLTIVRPGIVFGAGGVEMLPMFRAIRRIHVHAVAGFRSPRCR